MLKKILLALMFAITATTNVTYAEDDMKTVASKAYVDTQIETKQLKIPAAGQPNVGAGETVMTYTATGNGQIGERGLYSDISSYDANADGDKLITASALNATFTNLPTTPTTKLECANQADGCTLWTIVDQTAYGRGKNLLDMSDNNIVLGYYINNSGERAYNASNFYNQTFIPVSADTTYTWSTSSSINYISFMEYDVTKTFLKRTLIGSPAGTSGQFTTRNDTAYILIGSNPFGGSLTMEQIQAVNWQFELGSTATPYEPYNPDVLNP